MKDDHVAILLEDLHSKFDAVTELASGVVHDVKALKASVQNLQDDTTEIKGNVRVIKIAVTDQTHQLKDHERRVKRLERRAA